MLSGRVADDIESCADGLTTSLLFVLAHWWGLVRTDAPQSSAVWWPPRRLGSWVPATTTTSTLLPPEEVRAIVGA